MPNFHAFRRKRRPSQPVRFWMARVRSTIDPSDLSPGDSATHTVAIRNLDAEKYSLTISARCTGPRLRYGEAATWTPEEVVCPPESDLDPAAQTEVTLADLGDDHPLPAVEQIEMKLTMQLNYPNREPQEEPYVHTLRLAPRS